MLPGVASENFLPSRCVLDNVRRIQMTGGNAPRRTSLVLPITLILVGGIFLYANWRPSFDPWPILRTYWPLILVFVGLGKMWDAARSRQAGTGDTRAGVSL